MKIDIPCRVGDMVWGKDVFGTEQEAWEAVERAKMVEVDVC